MEEEGLVLEIEGRAAKVQIEPKAACGFCHACSMGLDNKMIIEAENEIGAKVGERVKIEVAAPHYLIAVLVVFIFPLMGLVIGCIIGQKIFGTELASICFGMAGLILSFGIIYGLNCWIDKRPKRKSKLNPKIIKVIAQ